MTTNIRFLRTSFFCSQVQALDYRCTRMQPVIIFNLSPSEEIVNIVHGTKICWIGAKNVSPNKKPAFATILKLVCNFLSCSETFGNLLKLAALRIMFTQAWLLSVCRSLIDFSGNIFIETQDSRLIYSIGITWFCRQCGVCCHLSGTWVKLLRKSTLPITWWKSLFAKRIWAKAYEFRKWIFPTKMPSH